MPTHKKAINLQSSPPMLEMLAQDKWADIAVALNKQRRPGQAFGFNAINALHHSMGKHHD